MKVNTKIILLFLSLISISPLLAAPAPHDPGYRIGPGDVLDIAVWKVEDLTRQVTVLPDGRISFPLVGEVMAQGMSVADLQKELEKRITPFVPAPALSVAVRQVNSLMIYVVGKVHKPGRFPLNCEVNVMQALAMAGGLNAFAKPDRIKIFRQGQGGTQVLAFDYDDVAGGRDLAQNIDLQRGDVIVVP